MIIVNRNILKKQVIARNAIHYPVLVKLNHSITSSAANQQTLAQVSIMTQIVTSINNIYKEHQESKILSLLIWTFLDM